jgi:hypothetical protein
MTIIEGDPKGVAEYPAHPRGTAQILQHHHLVISPFIDMAQYVVPYFCHINSWFIEDRRGGCDDEANAD